MGNKAIKVQCTKCYSFNIEDSRFCNKCGSPLGEIPETLTYPPSREHKTDDRLNFLPGDSFGARYRIVEEIGRGGMGRVYKAEDKELGITVALKMIRPEYSSSPRFIKRFKKETLLARSISHENVIRIHDLGEVNEIKFISMEYIKGQNLKGFICTSGTLTVETTISITRQICEALRVAHQKGIAHRDLKPQNIMIDNNGKVYTMDFGLAISIEAQEDSLSRGIIGTPQYLSPEQAKGEKADQRSDIYSLGIIIFEMLTGKRPFEAETAAGYIQKHIYEMPPSPSETNPLIPPFLEKIILRCLEKDREKRYQSVEEILKDLEEQKVESRILIPRPRVKKLLKFAYFIPLILLIALGIYLLIGRKKPVIPSISAGGRISVAVMYFENNTGDKSLDHWRKSLSDLMIQDLSQSKYIRVLTGDRLFNILRQLKLLEAKTYSSEDLKRVAALGRANHILVGNYSRAEDTFRINTILQNVVTEELIGSKREEGKGLGSFFSMVDELTIWTKSKLNITRHEIAADIDREIGKIITSSPEALEYYIKGKQYYQEGEFQESNEALEKAVEIDPGFALAYKRISENYCYLDKIDQAKKYIQKALSLMDRVSDRERYLVQGFAYTVLEDSSEKAIETYKKMLKYYPDDEDGNTYLGAIYREMEEWDMAFERFEKVLKVNPVIACENLALFYRAKGLYEKAREILQANQHNYFNQALFHWDMGLIYLCQGRENLALLEIENALSFDPDYYLGTKLMGHIYHIQSNFQAAEYYYRQLIDKNDSLSQLDGRFWLAHLYLTQGQYENCKNEIIQGITESKKFRLKPGKLSFLLFLAYLNLQTKDLDEALDASDHAEENATEINFTMDIILALHFRGLIHLEMKKINEAKNTAEQLKQLIEKTGKQKHMRYYHHLMGMIAQNKNMTSFAIEDFEKALSLLPHQYEVTDKHAFYLYPLALSYYQLGDLEKARKQFEKIVSLTTGRIHWGDIYARSYYWLGKIFQKKGWTGKAIENYEKFLQLWKDADPGLPETMDAQKQLAALRNASKE